MEKLFSEVPEIFGPFESTVRVPEYTSVPVTRQILNIIDTREMQRLRLIKQLGFVSLVFPGAQHTRFEHSLGVYGRIRALLKHLCESEGLLDYASADLVKKMLVGCLVHDLGHYLSAHVIEELGKIKDISRNLSQFDHLETGYKILTHKNSEVGEAIEQNFGIDRKELANFVYRKKHGGGFAGEVYSLLDGPIDVDKMDYLERDSIHTGVPYGRNFDASRLLDNFIILDRDGRQQILLKEKGKAGAEVFIFSRYVMFTEVYWHHTARCFSAMFRRAFMDLVCNGISVEELIGENIYKKHGWRYFGDDESFQVVYKMAVAGGRKTVVARQLLDAINSGRKGLYKRLLTLKGASAPTGKQYESKLIAKRVVKTYTKGLESWLGLCRRLAARVGELAGVPEMREHHILIDTPLLGDRGTTYPFYFPAENLVRDITEVSPIAGALDNMFNESAQQVRLYCHTDYRDRITPDQAQTALFDCLD